MSGNGPDKPRDAWDLVEDAMAEEELERVAKLSPEELRKELDAEGVDHELARAIGKRALEAANASAEPPAKAPVVPGKVVSFLEARERKRRSPAVWLLAAAAAAAVIGLGIANRDTVVAWFTPTPEPPVPTEMTPRPPSPSLLASVPRREAQRLCAEGYWYECLSKLDEAKAIDPAGESDPFVIDLRAEIVAMEQNKPDGADYVKPPAPGRNPRKK